METHESIPSFNPDTLEGAREAADAGQLGQWIQSHLRMEFNPNLGLAEGLSGLETRTYWGLVELDLDTIRQVCGPGEDMLYPEDQDKWDKRINILVKRMESGWNPPPFIVDGGDGPPYYLADGNHRLGALQKLGKTKYWSILYFEDETAKQKYLLNENQA
jgi:hypothetical protein